MDNPNKPLHTISVFKILMDCGIIEANKPKEYYNQWRSGISLSIDALQEVKTITKTGEKVGRSKVYIYPKVETIMLSNQS